MCPHRPSIAGKPGRLDRTSQSLSAHAARTAVHHEIVQRHSEVLTFITGAMRTFSIILIFSRMIMTSFDSS
jgi:hypothetical protein